MKKTTKIIMAAMFIALCFVGGNIKIMGSIAFDSLFAFVGTLLLGPYFGAAIGALAHLLSALLSGFPLSLPVHLITALMMAVTMLGFYFTIKLMQKTKLNKIISYVCGGIVALILNVPVSLFVLIPLMGKAVAISLIPVLLPAAAANVVLALIVFALIPQKYKSQIK